MTDVTDGSFGESVRATRCPYAPLTVWRQIDVDPELIDRHGTPVLERMGALVRERIRAGDDADLDMLAIRLDHPSITGDLAAFTRAAALFVRGLLGPQGIPGPDDSGETGWVAWIDDKRLFIFTLCPFYGQSHPRRSATASAFVVIQFLSSFRKINMQRMSLAEKKQLSDRVKSIFTRAGIDYFAYITQDPAEELKLVKPLKQGDEPIRWWRTL